MELGRELPSANVVSKSLGRTQFPSVKCDIFAKLWERGGASSTLSDPKSAIFAICDLRFNLRFNSLRFKTSIQIERFLAISPSAPTPPHSSPAPVKPHGVPGGPKRPQEASGGTSRNQEEPGGLPGAS